MKRTIIGILLIIAALCIVLSAAGIPLGFIGELSIVDIILSTVCLAIIVNIVIDGHYGAIPFPLAIMFVFLEDDIARISGRTDENLVSNWLVFACAIMMAIGISFITSPFKFKKICSSKSSDEYNCKFGSESKYLNCENFSKFWYSVKMGDSSIYFENIEQYKGDGVLSVSVKMGNLCIYVPSSWNLHADIQNKFGNLDIPENIDTDGPVLKIVGENKMGNIEIKRV